MKAPVRRLALVGIVALVGVAQGRPSPARAAPADARLAVDFEEGAQAPAYGWSQDDGCPARTGASAARPLRGALERAWRFVTKEGTIEGEPLAWKDRVFVVERAAKRRIVRVIAAATGVEKGSFAVDASAPLFPSVGEGRIVLKTSATTVEALNVGDASPSRRWKITAKEGIGAATLVRDEVYVVRDGVLERWAYGASAPAWPRDAAGSGAIKVERDVPAAGAAAAPPRYPRPSVRGGSVFVTSGAELVEVDRATGAERGRASFESAVDPETSRVVVAAKDVFVRRGAPVAAGGVDTHRFARSSPGSFEGRSGLSLPQGLVTAGSAWIAVVEDGGERRLCGYRAAQPDDEPAYLFAAKGTHDEFVATMPLTYAPGTVYAGLRAFAVPSLTVLRPTGSAVASRAIPIRDRVLVVENPTTLAAWREVRGADERMCVRPPAPAAGAGAPISLKACRAALDDGRILDGPFTYDPKANLFRATKPGEVVSCPARAVQAVLSSDSPRRLLLACRPSDAAAGVTAFARAEEAKELVAVAVAATAAGDAELARRALGGAVEHGAIEADVRAAEAAVTALEASPKPRDEAKAAEATAHLEALAHREPDLLVEVADALPKEASVDVGVELVRAAVDREPEHAGAAKWVRARLPKELPLPEPLRLDEWLDFIAVRGRLKVRVWGMSKDNQTVWGSNEDKPSDDSPLFKDFFAARSTWPGDVDVVAFECGPLVVFSPLERPGSIVRCLALGRLVSDTLDKVFEPIAPPRKDAESLILHLFSNQKQYLEQSRPLGPAGEAERADGLESTAGHYSPSDNVTRMYFPDDEENAAEVPGVYAHELTHHWLERRRPGPGGADRGDRSSSAPGYWVVEGFADFVRGFVFDVDAQKAVAENPRAEYADCLSGIAPDALIPWGTCLGMTQAEFAKLSMEDSIPVARRWRLGPTGRTVPKVLFYDQGSATCAYLYLAENQKHRKALLDFVYAYYQGQTKADTLERSTGLTAEELGKRVVAWCRELVKKG